MSESADVCWLPYLCAADYVDRVENDALASAMATYRRETNDENLGPLVSMATAPLEAAFIMNVLSPALYMSYGLVVRNFGATWAAGRALTRAQSEQVAAAYSAAVSCAY